MERSKLTPVQEEILKALETAGDKSRFSEAVLAKKIRETAGIDGKKKAGISLADLEKAISFQEENGIAFYAVIMNSANDIIIEKTDESRPISAEARSRRLKSEKSMTIITNADVKSGGKKSKTVDKKKNRRPKDFFDEED